jgi:hypothetical protein
LRTARPRSAGAALFLVAELARRSRSGRRAARRRTAAAHPLSSHPTRSSASHPAWSTRSKTSTSPSHTVSPVGARSWTCTVSTCFDPQSCKWRIASWRAGCRQTVALHEGPLRGDHAHRLRLCCPFNPTGHLYLHCGCQFADFRGRIRRYAHLVLLEQGSPLPRAAATARSPQERQPPPQGTDGSGEATHPPSSCASLASCFASAIADCGVEAAHFAAPAASSHSAPKTATRAGWLPPSGCRSSPSDRPALQQRRQECSKPNRSHPLPNGAS